MGLTSKTVEFQNQLTQLINSCGLPPVVIRLCLDVAHIQVDILVNQETTREATARKERNENGDTDSH